MMELMPVSWLHARMTHASKNGTTYLRRSRDSLILSPVEVFAFSAATVSSISFNSISACSSVRERRSAARAASIFPRRNSQRGDSAPKNERPVAVRQRNHRNADDKKNSAQRHHFFPAK